MSKSPSTFSYSERIVLGNLSRAYGVPESVVIRSAIRVVAYVLANNPNEKGSDIALDCVKAIESNQVHDQLYRETIADIRSIDTTLRALCKLREVNLNPENESA